MPAAPERLLVVDDTPTALEILTRTLRACGYEVAAAASVAEAVRAIEAGRSTWCSPTTACPGRAAWTSCGTCARTSRASAWSW